MSSLPTPYLPDSLPVRDHVLSIHNGIAGEHPAEGVEYFGDVLCCDMMVEHRAQPTAAAGAQFNPMGSQSIDQLCGGHVIPR